MSDSSQYPTADSLDWRFDHSYARLPEDFFQPAAPAVFPDPQLVIFNHGLAESLGLKTRSINDELLACLFSGRELPEDSFPIAQAYAGHQFGGFTMLGDGRAILLGEHIAPDQKRFDIQFKGSGQTPFSRRGDGKATLGPMLREYIISEAMHALGIPSTRSLAVVSTGEKVYRERPLPGAVLTRVAASHIRVGTFQYASGRGNLENLQALADYTIERHFPEWVDAEDKYLGFLNAVIDRQASLIAQWQSVGFIHGVMNTDNMSICGETIDYGPCAFIDTYHPETVFSSIDHGGRYAYGNQPPIAQWNLSRFAETLLPLLAPEQETAIEIATDALQSFPERYNAYWLKRMSRKLGIEDICEGDEALIQGILDWMQAQAADFTQTFTDLTQETLSGSQYQNDPFSNWHQLWRQRLSHQSSSVDSKAIMRSSNPVIVPRNHHVEESLAAAIEGDLQLFQQLLDAVCHPYEDRTNHARFKSPPPAGTCYQTFCGT